MLRFGSLLLLVLPCGSFLISPIGNPYRIKGRLSYIPSPEDLLGAGNLTTVDRAITLQQQAQTLRAEALSLQRDLNESKVQKLQKETTNIDRWIEHLLVNYTVNEDTQLLNTVDQVMEILKDGRYSQEQVNKIFKRICETGPPQSRSKCSPLMSLLVDAACKLDCLDREDNPNKRWSGRVERDLRKKLFAMDWGIEIEDEDGINLMDRNP
jgi:hypothetical protein